MKFKLEIELVPKPLWRASLRSLLIPETWDKLRKDCYQKANNCCEICGDTSRNQGCNHDLEAHEIWEYDDRRRIQKLAGIIGLCHRCHLVKHLGYASASGQYHVAILHFMKVNQITDEKIIESYLQREQVRWEVRSTFPDWQLDLSFLETLKHVIQS